MYKICDTCETAIHCAKYGCIPERIGSKPAQQEPVGVVNIESHSTHGWRVADFELTQALPFGRHSLYTAPPAQRTWVGLTKEERDELWYRLGYMDLMIAIEAKLKEKNT